MKLKLQIGLAATMCAIVMAPTASAQSLRREQDRRQETKNEWRNIAIASGIVGILGLLKDDKTLTFVGGAGALYSAYRYEQDRKSQDRLSRARYTYFSQPYFYRDGKRYDRQTVNRNGQKYYQFVCRDNDRNNGWNDRDTRWDDRDDRWDDRDDRRGCARHSSWNDRCDSCRDVRHNGNWNNGSNGNWGNGHSNGNWNDRRDDDRRNGSSNGNWNNGRRSNDDDDRNRSSKSKGKGSSKNSKGKSGRG